MNLESRIEAAKEIPKPSRFRDWPLWQRGLAIALTVAAIAVGLVERQTPAIAAPTPPTVTVSTPPANEVSRSEGRVDASSSAHASLAR